MISKLKSNFGSTVQTTSDLIVAVRIPVLTILILTGLVGCNPSDSIAITGSKDAIVSTGLNSNHSTADPNINMEKQHKRITVTGEMGIILPRTGHPYGTVENRETGRLYNLYGCDINLHKKLMEKLQSMYDAKKWPVDIKATGFLQSPGFIPDDLTNIICITDPDHVLQ